MSSPNRLCPRRITFYSLSRRDLLQRDPIGYDVTVKIVERYSLWLPCARQKPRSTTLPATGKSANDGSVRRRCLRDLRRSQGLVSGPREALPAVGRSHVQRGQGREVRRHGVSASIPRQTMELLHRARRDRVWPDAPNRYFDLFVKKSSTYTETNVST